MNEQNFQLNSPLSPKEKKVLEYIEVFMIKQGVAPSYLEIKEHFNFASFNSIQRYLAQLARKGYIHIPGGNQKRAIQILKSSDFVQEHLQNLKTKNMETHNLHSQNFENKSRLSPFVGSSPKREVSTLMSSHTQRQASESLSLPLLGKVAAGLPFEARDFNEYVEVPPHLAAKSQKSYVLKVVGTSMIDEGILDGDMIIVEDSSEAKNGDLIVATVDDEATVKRIYYHKNKDDTNSTLELRVELRPSNPNMNSFWLKASQVHIKGRVISLIRKF